MDCVMGSGCQRAQICSLTMLHVSHPYLISLSFYTIPICLFLFTGFLLVDVWGYDREFVHHLLLLLLQIELA